MITGRDDIQESMDSHVNFRFEGKYQEARFSFKFHSCKSCKNQEICVGTRYHKRTKNSQEQAVTYETESYTVGFLHAIFLMCFNDATIWVSLNWKVGQNISGNLI